MVVFVASMFDPRTEGHDGQLIIRGTRLGSLVSLTFKGNHLRVIGMVSAASNLGCRVWQTPTRPLRGLTHIEIRTRHQLDLHVGPCPRGIRIPHGHDILSHGYDGGRVGRGGGRCGKGGCEEQQDGEDEGEHRVQLFRTGRGTKRLSRNVLLLM